MTGTDQNTLRFLVSGYTNNASDPGVRTYELDRYTGKAELVDAAAGVASPSYVELDNREHDFLYAASETPSQGGLAQFSLSTAGVPALESSVNFPHAAGTCFTLVHPDGKQLFGADYNSGSLSSCALDPSGKLSKTVTLVQHEGHGAPRKSNDPNFNRQQEPHVHTLSLPPLAENSSLLAAVDLGLDAIVLYQIDESGHIVDAKNDTVINVWPERLGASWLNRTENTQDYRVQTSNVETEFFEHSGAHTKYCLNRQAPGFDGAASAMFPVRPAAITEAPLYAGPRIIAYHPSGEYAALICELSCELIIFHLDRSGLIWQPIKRWDLLQWSNPSDHSTLTSYPPLAAHVQFSSDARFLYASVRGTDQLLVFTLDEELDYTQVEVYPTGGATPRHFALSPDETFLVVGNKVGNNVAVFRRDPADGKLEQTATIEAPSPSCIAWL